MTDENETKPPPIVSGAGRPIVNVKTAFKPVVLWECPGCETKSEGNDPAMVKYLVAGNHAGIKCHACGVEIVLQIPKVEKVKPNIVTPQQHSAELNRHERRRLAKGNGGRGK